MHWVWTNISSIYYFTEIPIILKQHIQSDWITNVLGTLSAHGYFKLWRTSFSMNKPTTWCKSGRVSLVSSNCLYKTQPERALAQVCHTRIDALSLDEYQFQTDRQTDGRCETSVPLFQLSWSKGYKNKMATWPAYLYIKSLISLRISIIKRRQPTILSLLKQSLNLKRKDNPPSYHY